MKNKRKHPISENYVVVNQDGEVFTGLRYGSFEYSSDWSKAKPLDLPSTHYLMRVKGNELIKESEL